MGHPAHVHPGDNLICQDIEQIVKLMLFDMEIRKLSDTIKNRLLAYLLTYLTPQRKARFNEVLRYRTRHLTVVAEDTFREHNASALIRTCDCFGIQDMHVIEEYHTFRIARGMAKGAQKWVGVHFYNEHEDNVQYCIDTLQKKDYRIVAASPYQNDKTLEDFDIQKPAAIFFGKEKAGLSKQVLDQADDFIRIPMVGFSGSFNISVSAAIILHTLTGQLHRRTDINWQLSDPEVTELKLDWCLKTIHNGSNIAARFLKDM